MRLAGALAVLRPGERQWAPDPGPVPRSGSLLSYVYGHVCVWKKVLSVAQKLHVSNCRSA